MLIIALIIGCLVLGYLRKAWWWVLVGAVPIAVVLVLFPYSQPTHPAAQVYFDAGVVMTTIVIAYVAFLIGIGAAKVLRK